MASRYTALTFTRSVRQAQEHYGTRASAARFEARGLDDSRLSEREASFIASRDSFYLATVSEDLWPYVQFRGGPPGFLKVLDPLTLGYADFRGNGQYLSVGNLRHSDRAALFFMDYPGRRRLKVLARSEVRDAEEHPELLADLADPDYPGRVERLVLFHVAAFDWNCPQHITPRFTEAELRERE